MPSKSVSDLVMVDQFLLNIVHVDCIRRMNGPLILEEKTLMNELSGVRSHWSKDLTAPDILEGNPTGSHSRNFFPSFAILKT